MKILMSSSNSYGKNGVTNIIMNLYRNINKDQFNIDFVAINEPEERIRKEIEKSGGKITIIKRDIIRPLCFIKEYSDACKGYDIVHAHGNSATLALEMIAAKKASVAIRIAHSHSSSCKYMLIDKICRPIFYKYCNGYLACGERAGRWLYGKRKFEIINNGINVEQFVFDMDRRIKIRNELRWSDKKVIGHIGAFTKVKNQSFLIKIFDKLHQYDNSYRLLFVGDGKLKKEVEAKLTGTDLIDVVHFLGCTDQVQNYLCAMDLIVMPSLFEGFPLTLIEEQVNGLQCVISDSITKHADLTGNVIFLSLDKGIEEWVKTINKIEIPDRDRKQRSMDAIISIRNNGFDSKHSAKQLEQYYCDMVHTLH